MYSIHSLNTQLFLLLVIGPCQNPTMDKKKEKTQHLKYISPFNLLHTCIGKSKH